MLLKQGKKYILSVEMNLFLITYIPQKLFSCALPNEGCYLLDLRLQNSATQMALATHKTSPTTWSFIQSVTTTFVVVIQFFQLLKFLKHIKEQIEQLEDINTTVYHEVSHEARKLIYLGELFQVAYQFVSANMFMQVQHILFHQFKCGETSKCAVFKAYLTRRSA